MSILNSILPGGWFKGKEPSDNDPAADNNSKDKGWFTAVQRFNDKVAQLVSFNTKLLIFLMLLFFVYLLFASVFQGETFSINQINVHPSLVEKGYNSTFIAKKISYNIASLVNEVPEKLVAMFTSSSVEEKERLHNRIMEKYLKKEIKIDLDVNVGGINLPLRDLTKTARGLFDVEDKSLDGDLTVEDSLIIMTLGFNSNGINKSYESKKYKYIPKDAVKMIDMIDSITFDAAKFVLKQYDPLVTLLIDFNSKSVYSSRDIIWERNIYDEKERLKILKEIYLNYKKDPELATWAHAITGAIYYHKFGMVGYQPYNTYALRHFEKTIEMDAFFIDIVGNDLVKCYHYEKNPESENKIVQTYWKMIRSNPGNIEIHLKLLEIFSKQTNEVCYFNILESAFQNGLYIPESAMNSYYYKEFNKKVQFKALVKKYNEKNKPLFN